MSRYVLLADHNPEVCPASNAKSRARMMQGLNPENAAKVAESLGLDTLFGPVHLDPSHRTLVVFEGDSIEAVNRWVIETGLFQWNTVEVSSLTAIEEMMPMILDAPIVFD